MVTHNERRIKLFIIGKKNRGRDKIIEIRISVTGCSFI